MCPFINNTLKRSVKTTAGDCGSQVGLRLPMKYIEDEKIGGCENWAWQAMKKEEA